MLSEVLFYLYNLMIFVDLDVIQGKSEYQSEAYTAYAERGTEFMTQKYAKYQKSCFGMKRYLNNVSIAIKKSFGRIFLPSSKLLGR
jgi:hypothetical protein